MDKKKPNMKPEIPNLLEESIGTTLHGRGFLNKTPSTQELRTRAVKFP